MPPPRAAFSWLAWTGGLLIALLVGLFFNFFAGLGAMAIGSQPIGALVGLIPGVLFILLGRATRQDGYGQGLLTGGCVVALIGGLCGFAMGSG